MAPDAPSGPVQVALDFADILERLHVPYLVAGSLASSLHGEPRSTNDIDIVADLRAQHVADLLAALGDRYYVSPDAVRDAARGGGSFNAVHLGAAVKVDVFVVAGDVFDTERLGRRQKAPVSTDPPRDLFLDAPENTVLRKLEWYRRGGEVSERQWRDVLGVMRVQGRRLDRAYLATWAQRLGVSDLLARAEERAGIDTEA